MGRLALALLAVLGGLAFWRRKTLKDDAATVTEAARSGVERIKGGAEEEGGSEEDPATGDDDAASDATEATEATEEADDSTDA
jgi:hypothetical protein